MSALTITSPIAGQALSGTFNITGTAAGTTLTADDGSTVLGSQAVAGGSFSISVNSVSLGLPNGVQTLTVSDGVNTATVSVNINNNVPSSSGSTLTSTTGSLIDSALIVWTLNNQGSGNYDVFKNGSAAGYSNQVTTLLYYNGVIWQENTSNLWWPWSGTTWTGTGVGDPRTSSATLAVAAPTANESLLSPVTVSGTSNQSSVTVSNAGVTLATYTVTSGAFSGSLALAAGTYDLVFAAGTATPVSVPLTVLPVSSGNGPIHFYGVNGHYTQGGVYASNIAQQVTDMQAMGIKTIRQDCYSTSDTATMASLISQFSPIVIQPIFDVYPSPSATQAAAYSQFYSYGVTVAQQLAGKVPVIELMNEPENFYNGGMSSSNNGQNISDWSANQSEWPALVGACAGFIAGFRSIDTTKQTLIASPSVGWGHYGLLNALWTGTYLNGITGQTAVTWDLTNYHWYLDMGNIETALSVNIPAYLQSTYGKPIILTEIGVQTSVSGSTYDSWISSGGLGLYQSIASTYNIVNCCWYMLYTFGSSPDMGLYSSPGTQNAARASTMASFISAHPMS